MTTVKNHMGENAVQRLLRQLKAFNQELITDSAKHIELRLGVTPGVGELALIDANGAVYRLIGGSMEEIEGFLAASQLDRLLAARADAAQESQE